jgi:serine/threonine protein kinase
LSRDEVYCALKVKAFDPDSTKKEAEILKMLQYADDGIVRLYDVFEVNGPYGSHEVLALEPLVLPLGQCQDMFNESLGQKDSDGSGWVKFASRIIYQILQSLEFMHSKRVIHGGKSSQYECFVIYPNFSLLDICPANLMLAPSGILNDDSVGKLPFPSKKRVWDPNFNFVKGFEDNGNLPEYIAKNIPLYKSSPNVADDAMEATEVVFIDFGKSFQEGDHDGATKAYSLDLTLEHCPPEKELGLCLSTKSDIWAVGILIHQYLLGEPVIDIDNRDELLSCVTYLIGPMPLHLLEKWENSDQYVDKKGRLLRREVNEGKIPFDCPEGMKDPNERYQFRDFIGCMLQWEADERWSANRLLKHPWIQDYVLERGLAISRKN